MNSSLRKGKERKYCSQKWDQGLSPTDWEMVIIPLTTLKMPENWLDLWGKMQIGYLGGHGEQEVGYEEPELRKEVKAAEAGELKP